MKRILLIFAIVAGVTVASFAQKSPSSGSKNKLGIGLEFGLPLGDFGDEYSIAFGGAGKFERKVSKQFGVTVTAGYTSLYFKKNLVEGWFDEDAVGVVPIKAGGKYYFGAAQNIYLEGEVGALIDIGVAQLDFIYSPGIGISFPVSDKSAIDAGVRYEKAGIMTKEL